MKTHLASLLKLMLFIPLALLANKAISQNSDHVILEATSPKVTIRKYSMETSKMENFVAYYSPKHKRLLFDKTDFEMFPDTEYYLVKARFKMFSVKGFKDNPEEEITHIQVKYYYVKSNPINSKSEEFVISRELGASYYPGLRMVKDVIQKDQGDIRFVIDDNTQWLMENNGKSEDSIFYIDQNKTLPQLTYVLMFSDLKRIIVNGKKVSG